MRKSYIIVADSSTNLYRDGDTDFVPVPLRILAGEKEYVDDETLDVAGMLAAKLAPHGYEPRQLVDAIWAGTAAMVQNDGRETNEAAFWKRFAGIYGDKVLAFCRRWIHWPLASGACKMMNGITACW